MISYQIDDTQTAKISAGGVVFRPAESGFEFAVLERKPRGSYNPTDSSTYHLPKGTLESGETLEQAAKREIQEEAGLVVELKQYLGASVLPLRREKKPAYRDRDNNEITIIYFVAEYVSDSPAGMDAEHDQVLWLNAEAAVSKLENYWKHEDEYINRAVQWLNEHDSAE